MKMQIWMPHAELSASAKDLSVVHLKKNFHTIKWLVKYYGRATGAPKYAKYSANALVIMWAQHYDFLLRYKNTILREWVEGRCLSARELDSGLSAVWITEHTLASPPWWFGHQEFHDSHKSSLLALDYIYYGRKGWDVPLVLDPWCPDSNHVVLRNYKKKNASSDPDALRRRDTKCQSFGYTSSVKKL